MKPHPLLLSESYYNRLNDAHRFPTPQSTVEAIVYCVHRRGVDALKVPANVERLSRCDAAARKEINERIKAFLNRKEKASVSHHRL
jgi:hypothetical protein